MVKLWKIVTIGISALVLSDFLALGYSPLERLSVRAGPCDPGLRLSMQAVFPETPQAGEAVVWYLGHCGFAVRTQNHLLIFDYQELRDGARPKARPAKLSLEEGWIDPKEIKDLAVCVFVSHSHNDHFDPVIFNWQKAIPDITYYFGWKAADDPAFHYLVGPQAELKSDGLEIATINSHHSGVPEVAWLVKVDGLVIYHNGDCRPDDPSSAHDFLKTTTDAIDLAFVFPVYEDGQKYTAQTTDFFRKFRVRAAFPMHAQAGDAMYLGFQKAFQAKFPGLSIHVPMNMGQKFVLQDIFGALRKGDIQTVKALVTKDPKVVNEKDTRGRTPLHFASDAGNREIVAFLIANGADVKATDSDGFTPLHWAASAGKAEAARALIAAGADPNVRGARGATPLESAFYGRHPEAVEALLQGGLKVETKGEEGRVLLHRAASAGFLTLVDYLLAHGADAESRQDLGRTLLHSAAEGGLVALVGKLVEGGADVNAQDDLGQTPLHLAAEAGRRDVVELLLAKGADMKAVCRDGRNLLHSAAAGGLTDLMERLIKAGFPVDGPDRYGRTPLLKAAEAGSDATAEILLSRGANVMSRDYYQQTPLHEAAFSGNLRLLEILVKHGADVHAVNEEGSTPLLYISQAGREEAMNWLIEHGAKLDVRNKWNETPLTFPLGNGFQQLVEKLWPRAEALKNRDLLEKYPLHRVAYLGMDQAAAFLLGKGVPIDLKDESGRTPFQRAAQGGSVKIAQMLLDKGAKVEATDPEGSIPLHLAVKKGRTDMVRFLLQKGADPKAKDGKGRTPLDLAGEYSYPAIAGILKDAGAESKPSGETGDVAPLLAKPLKTREAIVWSLGHCGFAVKTRSRLLIFDYFSRGWTRPEKPTLANGFIDPEEIKDQEVVVFVSHAHGDHFDPVILSWRQTVKDITYVFGWNARKGERSIDLPAPRATTTIKGMDVFTVNCEHNDVPEVAYLVKLDGLSIYHSGDYMGPVDGYQADMDYLLEQAGRVDLAFIGKYNQAESLKPKVVFPIHANNREYMYGAFAREAAQKKLPSRVICPENKGDRFMLF